MVVGIARPSCTSAVRGSSSSVLLVCLLVFLVASIAEAQTPVRKTVLIINEVGQAHPAVALVNDRVMSRMAADQRYQIEFYVESLDTPLFTDERSEKENEAELLRQYENRKIDIIVAVGPGPIRFLSQVEETFLAGVPIVFCGSTQVQAGFPKLSSRFTGSWMNFDSTRTIEAAMRLSPQIRKVVVVSGSSEFDQENLKLTKSSLEAHPLPLEFTYLTDLDMTSLLERLRKLPEHTIVLYVSFFRDANGNQFVNATTALPLVSAAANAPVFGVSDVYVGRGIVGGYVVSFADQAKIAAELVSQILAGKNPTEIPIVDGPSAYMFDARQLKRWNLSQSRLPPGSIVLNREPTPWQKARWIVFSGLAIILGLTALVGYLMYERKQVNAARNEQMRLSGLLINAHDEERSRLAGEIHDDFSQRLAVLSLGLETVDEGIPESMLETHRQMQELMQSASEFGADLHSLSHRLHSTTLERLGLAAGVASFCKEFSAQHGTQVAFSQQDLPPSVSPEIELCLFRIVQEGLRNVQKHSGAAHAQVRIEKVDNTLHLSISDDGVGFDVEDGSRPLGLGLWSMRKRIHLISGRFEIHSDMQQGTRVEVWAPIKFDSVPSRNDSVAGHVPGTAATSEPGAIRNAGRLMLGATGTED
jgi:signal transduction histidine kinase